VYTPLCLCELNEQFATTEFLCGGCKVLNYQLQKPEILKYEGTRCKSRNVYFHRTHVSCKRVQWTQNNPELVLIYSKRGRRDNGKSNMQQDCKESVWACTVRLRKKFFNSVTNMAFWYSDLYTTLCFMKQRNYNISNADTPYHSRPDSIA
jgi:hypothetical protein